MLIMYIVYTCGKVCLYMHIAFENKQCYASCTAMLKHKNCLHNINTHCKCNDGVYEGLTRTLKNTPTAPIRGQQQIVDSKASQM